jgi:hypothetical protein
VIIAGLISASRKSCCRHIQGGWKQTGGPQQLPPALGVQLDLFRQGRDGMAPFFIAVQLFIYLSSTNAQILREEM